MYKKQSGKPKVRLPLQERALALAARKLRSVAELRKTLLSEEYAAGEIEAALERLQEIHLVNDEKLAQSVGRQYSNRGNRFITQKLKQRGISAELCEPALEELPDETDRAMAAGEKKLKSLQGLEPRVAGQKLYQHLALRGFSGSLIQKVVRQLLRGSDENFEE